MIYNLPATAFASIRLRPVIVRAEVPDTLCALLGPPVPEDIVFAQLTGLTGDPGALARCGEGLALDLTMTDPLAEWPLLYQYASLLERHPVRISIPWRPGLFQAVKLALALGFAVRLTGHQPSPDAIAESRQALEHFLYNPTVAHPVEPFHGLLHALVHRRPTRLWSLLERDPEEFCLLDARGDALAGQGPATVADWREGLVAGGSECRDCEWLTLCEGYFKWPDPGVACQEVRGLLATLSAAAHELRAALERHAKQQDSRDDG